jgi:hypothetical protein
MPILARAGAAAARGFGMLGKIAAAVDEYFKYVTLLLPGNGTNGAQNNTFLDSSTNNFTITRNGNTTQGTFTPYGSNWSNYFDGSGDYLSAPDNAAWYFTGDFTVECWAYWGNTSSSEANVLAQHRPASAANQAIEFWSNGTTLYLAYSSSNVTTTIAAGQWYHLAMSCTSGTASCYVNGVRIGTFSMPARIDSADPFTIGARTGSGGSGATGYFTGYISNVRVINGTGLYSGASFDPPNGPLQAITNTSLLTCQSNRFIDNSTNAFTITRNGDVSVQRFSPFNPTAPYAAGTDGGSGYFDGLGDDLTTPSNAAFTYGTGDFCVEGWFYFTGGVGGAGYSYAFAQGASTGSSSLGLYIQSGVYKVWNGSAVITGTASFVQNTWVHLAVTRSGTTMRLFVNGVQDGSATNSSNITTGTTTGISIGRWSEIGDTNYITGYVSGFRAVKGSAVYTAAFTPPTAPLTAISGTSLLCNFTNAGIIDNAEMNNLETVGNAQISTAQSKFGGGSMLFDGSGDWLAGPPTPQTDLGSGDFTIEAWLYRTASGAASDSGIVSRGAPSTLNGFVFAYTSANVLTFNFNYSGAIVTGATAISINTWTHVAVSRNGNTFRLFVNGVVDATATSTNSQTTNASDVFYVGRSGYDSGRIVTGYLDDVRLTKGVARYTSSFTAPTAPFPLS